MKKLRIFWGLTALLLVCTNLSVGVHAADPASYLMTSFLRSTDENNDDKLVEIKGVAIQFEGVQEVLAASDLTKLLLTIDGAPVNFSIENNITFNIDEVTDEDDFLPESHFYVHFTQPLTQPGLYAFSGEYKGMPFSALKLRWHEDGSFESVWDDDNDILDEIPDVPEEISEDAPAEVPASDAAETATASPAAATVLIDGETVSFDAYNIDDSNYFKLRDIAFALSGTEKQFEVTWDDASSAISLLSGQTYTAVGGEMAAGDGNPRAAAGSDALLLLDNIPAALTAYNIDGSTYFKLRDIGELLDFSVSWDSENNAIAILTTAGYTAE